MEYYLVGGAVRDECLGLPVSDRDYVVVGATPDMLKAKGYRQIGQTFPCFLNPVTQDEYALARTEKKAGAGHTGFICDFHPGITLEEDLSRRDLTINAIAKSENGEYIDPFNGLDDLRQRVLRHVSPAFAEDPLRVLRVARFASRYHDLGFRIAPETQALMRALVDSGELSNLTPERVWKETVRVLDQAHPSRFFIELRHVNALSVLMPEFDRLWREASSHESVNALNKIDNAAQQTCDARITFAVLALSIHRHTGNSDDAVSTLCDRLKVPTAFKQLALLVSRYADSCHTIMRLTAQPILSLLEQLDCYRKPERLHAFVKACEIDQLTDTQEHQAVYPQRKRLLDLSRVVQAVPVAPLVAQGLVGQAIADQLKLERIKAIEYYLSDQA